MRPKRTLGMTAVTLVSVVYGAMIAVGNTMEVLRGETFDGTPVSPAAGVLGLAGALFAALLVVGGIGTWRVRPYGRILSLVGAAGTLLASALAIVLLDLTVAYFLVGAIYPGLLLWAYNRPAWKAKFAAADAGEPVPAGGG